MKTSRFTRAGAAVLAGALALTLAACGSDNPLEGRPGVPEGLVVELTGPSVVGTFAGAGASSIEAAMDAWRAVFQGAHTSATVNYDPIGSGGGRRQLIAGGAVFAGSDMVLSDAEIAESRAVCGPEGAIDLPIYISPIAVTFNLPGIDTVNLSPDNLARIFSRDLTRWDDPAIAADNPGVDLPDLRITPVHRSDDSGTTANFVDYLSSVAPDVWIWDVSGQWPLTGGDSAQGTSGVINAVQQTVGGITYADASRVGALGTAKILVGDEWVGISAEGAALAVDASPLYEGRHELDLAIAVDRATDVPGAYPLVLVSFAVVCLQYQSEADADFVRQFLGFVTSEAGQQIAAQIAGSAPISGRLAADIQTSLAAITSVEGEL
ncbi:phosphate ABC transporter, periplasmic phosphate- binding protein [Xylanimonas cellulosilytica DSM 15894]|uniref:Phosphate-binding protein n=1 Tax=Xylanimonas cellulosilytica (strain DSM 15894 / JCM 12276 / CECT 5975 / KCTC 9989 / LMG 20990 / NBRC 107835 / XIL07) TaxID=446471 RepID=D1BZ77_XYLCX|nr:phosphate ABC transporter substrate-binding protein PstS [Xylanimonas cellulosilytica]ACZ31974.1 phosphate ABC transporter, periplasmic phosphate- binding protein [Xylanimonas cellulosilytica DSM 15894]